jgi:glycerol kinase
MMNEQLIGVIDVESEIVKFSILNHSGNIVLDSYRPIELIKPYPGWVEVDAENIWNALCTTINEHGI